MKTACNKILYFRLKKIFSAIFLLMVFPNIFYSQPANKSTIKGQVFSKETKKPLKNVNVYLLGTLKGAATNQNGEFIIHNVPNNSFYLVISCVGFETQKHLLKILNGHIVKRNFYLKKKTISLNEVTVNDKGADEWRKNLKIFKEQFIGVLNNSIFTQILNPYAINFTTTKDGWLVAKTNEPLIIRNDLLGYKIKYFLDTFRYKNPTVKYSGQPFFEEIEISDKRNKEVIGKARKKTYCGSLRHFLRTAVKQYITDSLKTDKSKTEKENVNDNKISLLEKNGFTVYQVGPDPTGKIITPIVYQVNTDNYFHPTSEPSQFYFKFPEKLKVVYLREREEKQFLENFYYNGAPPTGKQTSWISLPADSVLIDTTGYFFDSFHIRTYGYWAYDRVSNMLPYEYSLSDSTLIHYNED